MRSPGPAGGTPGVWPASPTLGGIWSRPSPPCRARSVSRSCPPGPRPPPHPPPPTAPASSRPNWIANPTYRFSKRTSSELTKVVTLPEQLSHRCRLVANSHFPAFSLAWQGSSPPATFSPCSVSRLPPSLLVTLSPCPRSPLVTFVTISWRHPPNVTTRP